MNKHDLDALFRSVRKYAEDKSHDAETKVGCYLVQIDDGRCVTWSKGANRFVSDNKELPRTRPEKHSYIVHAERSALYNAAKEGVSTDGLIAIVTLSPCIECCRALLLSGISTVYFEDEYHSFQHQLSTKDINFRLTKIGKYTKIELDLL